MTVGSSHGGGEVAEDYILIHRQQAERKREEGRW